MSKGLGLGVCPQIAQQLLKRLRLCSHEAIERLSSLFVPSLSAFSSLSQFAVNVTMTFHPCQQSDSFGQRKEQKHKSQDELADFSEGLEYSRIE